MRIIIDGGVGTITASTDNLQLIQLLEALKLKIESAGPKTVLDLLA